MSMAFTSVISFIFLSPLTVLQPFTYHSQSQKFAFDSLSKDSIGHILSLSQSTDQSLYLRGLKIQ